MLKHYVKVYVPSTNRDKKIPTNHFENRTSRVAGWLSDIFGGATIDKVQGCWISEQDNSLINEDINRVESFMDKKELEANKRAIRLQVKSWGKEWKQEAMSLEIDGKLEFIS